MKSKKRFFCIGLLLIFLLAIALVRKSLENDTFYTIKLGKLVLDHGIDMMDHFSMHAGLAYTYPHWLYDVFIYLIYHIGGFTGIYISSILLFLFLLFLVFRNNVKFTNRYFASFMATLICTLAIGGFVTARAQLLSFILFVCEFYFIEMFLKTGYKRYVIGLFFISLVLCNTHVAVWPFYFILFLPYLAEYFISFINKKIKKSNKLIRFIRKKIVIEDNSRYKFLILIMFLSLLTGLCTPIGDTPYTYLIKTMMGNSESYIQEHQMVSGMQCIFSIVMVFVTVMFGAMSKIKFRDLCLIGGLILMSIMSVRHIALLGLLGSLVFARTFSYFLENYRSDVDTKICNFMLKKGVLIILLICFGGVCYFGLSSHLKDEYIDSTFYPIDAVEFIKENVDIDNMRIYNEYNFGSYLLFYDIPVFIDSRADLYTKQFSGFQYDIFDDWHFMGNYEATYQFYDITHVLIYKSNPLSSVLKRDKKYEILYQDKNFIFFKRNVGE